MEKLFIIFLIGFLLSGCIGNTNTKNVNTPKDWRIPDKEDDINDWARFKSPNKIINDFNGDGKPDIAQILAKQRSSTGFSFIVQMGGNDKDPKQFVLEKNNDVRPQSTSIELLEPTNEIWESACEKGYWDCAADEIRQFKITKPSIQFCYIESACNIYIWSDRNQNFTRIPLSD